MPADLPPDQSRALAGVMLHLHGEFRRRHGLPPLPTAWTLQDYIEQVRQRSRLSDPAVFDSSRPGVGGLITRARVLLWQVLKPVLNPIVVRQSDVNRDVLLALEALARDHDHTRHVHRALSARVADLEDALTRLRQRDG